MRDQPVDPEQGIYHGLYRLGVWICITDRDVWTKNGTASNTSKQLDIVVEIVLISGFIAIF